MSSRGEMESDISNRLHLWSRPVGMMYRVYYRRPDGTEYAAPGFIPSSRAVIEEFVEHHNMMEGYAPHRWHTVIAVVEYPEARQS